MTRQISGPREHPRVTISDPRLGKMTARSWSYLNAKTRDVYVQVFTSGKHVVTISVRVPR